MSEVTLNVKNTEGGMTLDITEQRLIESWHNATSCVHIRRSVSVDDDAEVEEISRKLKATGKKAFQEYLVFAGVEPERAWKIADRYGVGKFEVEQSMQEYMLSKDPHIFDKLPEEYRSSKKRSIISKIFKR